MSPEMWTLRGERQRAHNLEIIHANCITPKLEVVGTLVEWQYQCFDDFETAVQKAIQSTSANVKEFISTIARLYVNQEHKLGLPLSKTVYQTAKYKLDGTYIDELAPENTKELEHVLLMLVAARADRDTPVFQDLKRPMQLEKLAVIGAASRLQFGAKVSPRYTATAKIR
ncbi:hypothetical protein B7463_g1269, partial [Scytalidium lignicola]